MDKDTAEVVQHLAISAAAIIGGAWAIYRFLLERAYETALEIDIQSTCQYLNESVLVFITVILTNKSKRKLTAKKSIVGGYAYKDCDETLKYSCSLQLKRIQHSTFGDKYLSWFKNPGLQLVEGIPDVNLLAEYEISEIGEVEYWMEPNETVHLGTALILSPGEYLLKATFIGDRKDTDFWSRIVHLHIENARQTKDQVAE